MFTRTRIINGRSYVYDEWRWREGGKVRSRSRIRKKIDWKATFKSEPGAKEADAAQFAHNEAYRQRMQKETPPLAVRSVQGGQVKQADEAAPQSAAPACEETSSPHS